MQYTRTLTELMSAAACFKATVHVVIASCASPSKIDTATKRYILDKHSSVCSRAGYHVEYILPVDAAAIHSHEPKVARHMQ